jgi:hypothetical protein
MLQRYLHGSQVVKVFNNIVSRHLPSLARPHRAADRSALPIAGDDDRAKATVTAFLDSIGYDAVDAGPLARAGVRNRVPGLPQPLRVVVRRNRDARRSRQDPRRLMAGSAARAR